MSATTLNAVVPGYYLVCYNMEVMDKAREVAVVPGYYLVCYNWRSTRKRNSLAVVPGYYLVCYNYYYLFREVQSL